MGMSIYNATVPALELALGNLVKIIDKGIAFAAEKKVDGSVLANARLAVDMFPFSSQIQRVSDSAKGAVARLAGIDNPSYEDNETTLEDLKARLVKTLDFIKSADASKFDSAETRDITLKAGPNELKFTGADYLTKFVLPNVYFHVTVAYAILRHNGVDVGKMDYLGNIQ